MYDLPYIALEIYYIMQKIKILSSSFLAILMLTIVFTSCEKDNTLETPENSTNTELDKRFKNYEVVEIDNAVLWNALENQPEQSVKLDMQDATSNDKIGKLSFTLNRMQVQTEDFKVYLINEDGQATEANIPDPHVLDGQINGGKGDAFMIVNNENFRAEFLIDGEVHRLEPFSDHFKDAAPNKYISYNVNDILVQEDFSCSLDETQAESDAINKEDKIEPLEKSVGNCLKVEITFMGDYALYAWRFNYNFNNTYNWMYWRMVNAGRMYYSYNGYPVNFLLKAGYVNNWNGYISHSTNNAYNYNLRWQNYVVNNSSWFQKGDVNILFTGNDIHPNSVGYAFIRSICNTNYGYNWGKGPFCTVEHQWSPYHEDITTAHEVGHVLGAYHSSGGFMNWNIYNGSGTWMHSSTWNDLDNWVWGHRWCLGYWWCQW